MSDNTLLPPSADSKKAEKYINQFVRLIDNDQLTVAHTDLSKFDPSALQDHFRLDFEDYSVEVSHSKQPNTAADSFVMLFTNIKQIAESGNCEKVILAYVHLDQNQFIRFKSAAQDQIDRIKKAEEEKRFLDAVAPIDAALEKLGNPIVTSETQNIDSVPEPDQTQLETDLEKNGMFLADFSNDRPIDNHEFPEKMATRNPLDSYPS